MNYLPYTVPIVFAFIGLEILTGWLTGRRLYRFNDAAANLSNGSLKRHGAIRGPVSTRHGDLYALDP